MNRRVKAFVGAVAVLAHLVSLSAYATTPVAHTIDQFQATGGTAIAVPSSGVWGTAVGGVGTWTQTSFVCNGSTTAFVLGFTPAASAAALVHLDGGLLLQGSGLDYTISSATITLASACASGQKLNVVYTH